MYDGRVLGSHYHEIAGWSRAKTGGVRIEERVVVSMCPNMIYYVHTIHFCRIAHFE